MDRAELLSAGERRALEARLGDFERETGHQIVVHTTPSLEGLDIETYGIEVAEAWKIGQRKLDNGAILTVAPAERKLRIDVGYGLEGVIPDALASRIIRETIGPEFRSGRMAQGIQAGVEQMMQLARGESLPLPARESPRRGLPLPWLVLLLFFLAPRLLGGFGGGRGSLRRIHRRAGFGFPPPGSWGGGGGFGGGGGGFSGGGGRFGGGGASGSW